MIRDESYVHIWGWMLSRLKLKWNELLVYATIYSFTNGTDEHCYKWSASYLAERCWTDKRNVYRILKKLEEKWYIQRKERIDNWVKFVDYVTPYDKMSVGGGDKMSPHNNSFSDNNNSSEKNSETLPKNEDSRAGELDVCARVESYNDIQEVIEDDSYRINNNKLLKCIIKMCDLWYVVNKKEKDIKKLVDWIKEKAEIYNIKNADWSIAQWTMLQIFDQWYEYWNARWNLTNHKTAVIRFMMNHNKPYKKK